MTAAKHTPLWYSSEHQAIINELADALGNLANEIRACWGMNELLLRQEIGNTNYSVVQLRLDEAMAALAKAGLA